MCTCSFVKIDSQLSSQNFLMEIRDPVLRLSSMWTKWAEYDNSLLLRGVWTVRVAHMEFPSAAVMMVPSEFGMTYLQIWPCDG